MYKLHSRFNKKYISGVPVILALIFSSCHSAKTTSAAATGHYTHHRLLIRDEGISQLAYIDLDNPAANWYTPLPVGRDVQLVGNGRVLAGTGNGYEEFELTTGKKVFELTRYPGTIAARRLRNGNTLLTGVNWQDKKGIVLVEVNAAGETKQLYVYPEYNYARLVRETASGNFLVTANNTIFESNRNGEIVWKAVIGDAEKTHAWQALRLANGQTVVSTGYQHKLEFFAADGKLIDTITGPEKVHPNFFAGFQILANGNFVVTNWQGHGPKMGASGTQVLEYTTAGKLAWHWQQDSTKFSSLHNAIVLDELDAQNMYIEDINGKLAPVTVPVIKN